jgi:hypothetical protein
VRKENMAYAKMKTEAVIENHQKMAASIKRKWRRRESGGVNRHQKWLMKEKKQ